MLDVIVAFATSTVSTSSFLRPMYILLPQFDQHAVNVQLVLACNEFPGTIFGGLDIFSKIQRVPSKLVAQNEISDTGFKDMDVT